MTTEEQNLSQENSLRFSVDPEHFAIRLAVALGFIVALIVFYFIFSALIQDSSGLNLLVWAGTLIAAALFIQVFEKALKRKFPSGRMLELEDNKVRLLLRDKVQREIDGSQELNVLTWRFTIQKRARAPKGWYVLAVALVQDDAYLPVYTFISPEDFEKLPDKDSYVALTPKKNVGQDMRLAGQERRLHNAETARWYEGAEIALTHYHAYIEALKARFPQWMPE